MLNKRLMIMNIEQYGQTALISFSYFLTCVFSGHLICFLFTFTLFQFMFVISYAHISDVPYSLCIWHSQ